ncbi:MAG: ribosome maturation factor RimM [Chloroflexota bacterium]
MPKGLTRLAGSHSAGGPAFLVIGMVRRPHGLKGEVLVAIRTDFPERLAPGTLVYAGDDYIELTIESRRPHNDGLLLKFSGIQTLDQVSPYKNLILYVPTSNRPTLPDGEYYYHQLLGLIVKAGSGMVYGRLTDIIQTGANDVYVVSRDSGGELLLPAIPEVIKEVDIPRGTITVELLPGLASEEITSG